MAMVMVGVVSTINTRRSLQPYTFRALIDRGQRVTRHVVNSFVMSNPKNMEALQSVVASIGKFSPEFYKILSSEESHNLICSPISVSIVLSMVALGAKGNTAKELRLGLLLTDDDTVTKTGIQSLIDILNNVKSSELRLANRIFPATGFEIKPEFNEITETFFRSTTQGVDYRRVPEACETINSWCSEQTNNRINDIMTPDIISDETKLVLANAVYFKGIWKKTFQSNYTKSKPFHINEKTTKDVPTMHKKDYYNYDRVPDLNASYIELPYKSTSATDAISMFVILPDAINGLKEVEDNLDKINFKDLHERKNSVQIALQLPKFKIVGEFDLGEVLQQMGMGDMFTSSANFRGITDIPLQVTKVLQKAFLEVNEEGSEAAAVTVVAMARCCMPLPPIEVTVNRPFFCAIVATNTGTQLFNARVVDPVAN